MGPIMKCVHNALKMLVGHILPKQAVAKCDLEHIVDVISKALIFPKFCQDSCNGSKSMLGPM
jgi:hypothetical protein